MKFGFTGATYTNQSKNASGERSVNLYPERIESGHGKGGAQYYTVKIPGLKKTHELPDKPLRCLYTGDGVRVFAVSGASLFELFEDGTFNLLGYVEQGTTPAQIFANGNQLFVVSGSGGFIADGLGHVTRVTDCCMGAYLDGFFCALEGAKPGDSNVFKISKILDGTSWDPLDFAAVEGSPDHIVSMITDHRQLLFFKQQDTEVFWDSGNADFPIERIDGSYVEQGCIAPWTPKRIDNTVMWLGGDERGAGVVWRMQGFTPTRVSNHAVENWIQSYTRAGLSISDAVSMVEQVQGHAFFHLHFPSALPLKPTANDPAFKASLGAVWTYDCSTGLWHERAHWDSIHGLWSAHWARFHCYAWGQHLVGGGDSPDGTTATGNVYDQSINYQDDDGKPLRWLRSAPHISDAGNKKIFFSNLWTDIQVGVGASTLLDQDGNEREPVILVRHSNDGGNTWNPESQMAIGKQGEFSFRARQTRCGSGRNRCIEISGSDPVPISIVDADIDAAAGTS